MRHYPPQVPTPEDIKERGKIGATMHPYDYELTLQRMARQFKAIPYYDVKVVGDCAVIAPHKFRPD